MPSGWTREDRPDLAGEKILDAAGKAFVELGVSGAGMAQIAEYAGCSRGTLYRYFKNRHELHLAYVDRTARRISRSVRTSVASIEDPRARLVEWVLRTVHEVRQDPAAMAWFEPGTAGIAARMSRSSEVVESLNVAVVSEVLGEPLEEARRRLVIRWLVRVITSLLTLPEETPAEERALIERFVIPGLFP